MEEYRRELEQLAAGNGVENRLVFAGFGPYREVPELASSCAVGLGIFTGQA
jgi:hypothetical protein